MNEEMNKNSESQQTNVPDNTDYIEALREMRNSTVSREQYDTLKDEECWDFPDFEAFMNATFLDGQPFRSLLPDLDWDAM